MNLKHSKRQNYDVMDFSLTQVYHTDFQGTFHRYQVVYLRHQIPSTLKKIKVADNHDCKWIFLI